MTAEAPTDGALLRLPVTGERWAEDLPPVPHGFEVTASFSDADAAAAHGEALSLLGYRVVGVAGGERDRPCADVLVPEELITSKARWWRALRGRAERAYGLGFGPVARALDDVLRLHVAEPTEG